MYISIYILICGRITFYKNKNGFKVKCVKVNKLGFYKAINVCVILIIKFMVRIYVLYILIYMF